MLDETPPALRPMPRLQRLFAALIDRSAWLAVLLLGLTLLAGWQATQLRVSVDMSGLIGANTEGARAIRAYEDRFLPLRGEEVLLVRAPDFGTEAALADLQDLVFELQFIDGVERVISLAALPAPGREGAWLTGPELADLPPDERLHRMRAEDPLAAQLISEDLTAAVVVVVPLEGRGGDVLAREVARASALVDGLDTVGVGILAVQRIIAEELLFDIMVLTPLAVLVCLLLSLVLFRRVVAVFVVAVPPITGVIWFFGWIGWSNIGFDPIMGALPVLLIVLAFSDALHIYHTAQHAIDAAPAVQGDARRDILARAVAETAPAAALTSLTTIIAFASLTIPDSPSLNAMALAGIGGMALSLVSVLLLTPVLMALMRAPKAPGHRSRLFGALLAPAQRIAGFGRGVSVATLVILGVCWSLQSQSQIGFRYVDYLPRGSEVTQALADMERQGLGSDRMILIVEADPMAPLARVQAAAGVVWGDVGWRWATGEGGLSMLPRMAARDGSAHALPVSLPIAAGDVRADAALRALETGLAEAGLASHTHFVGPGHALLVEGPHIVQALRFGLYATIAAITVIIALVFASWRLGLAALVVNLIPILGVEAWLVVIGRELTIMNVIALTIAFGIAVDDTLHFLNRYRLASGQDMTNRLRLALAESRPPMIATTAILLGGLLVTLISALPGMALYGVLIGLAVALALVADLFLLPGLIRWSHTS